MRPARIGAVTFGVAGLALALGTSALMVLASLWHVNPSGQALAGNIPEVEVWVFLKIVAVAFVGVGLLPVVPFAGGFAMLGTALLLYQWIAATGYFSFPLLGVPFACGGILGMLSGRPRPSDLVFGALVALGPLALVLHVESGVQKVSKAEAVKRQMWAGAERLAIVSDELIELMRVVEPGTYTSINRETPWMRRQQSAMQRLDAIYEQVENVGLMLKVRNAGPLLSEGRPDRLLQAAERLEPIPGEIDEVAALLGPRCQPCAPMSHAISQTACMLKSAVVATPCPGQ